MALKSLKKLSKSTALAALGVAMVAAVGSAPASAATVYYDLDVSFGSSGSAEGYYKVDSTKLPLAPGSGFGIPLLEWDVSVKDSAGAVLERFYNSYIGKASLANTLQFAGIFQAGIVNPVTGPNVALSFTNTSPFKQLTLQIPSTPANPFTGVIAPGTPILADFVNSNGPSIATNAGVTAVSDVPEPFTIAGTAVAGAIGFWTKRKKKASSAA